MLSKIGCVAVFATLARAQSVIELARKAPPELFADAVIRMVERGQLPPSSLEEAFQAAKQAKEPVRLVAIPPAADSRPALREAALRAGLAGAGMDALSLQARVVALMARTDAGKAREMFESIDHLALEAALEARPCADPMIADDSAYYEMAGKLTGVNTMAVVGPANSPGELASLAKLIRLASEAKLVHEDKALTPDEFRLLTGALGLKMQTAAPDYRAFTMTAEDLWMELDGLMARARELGVPADDLAMGARKLAVTQLSSPRCHEEFGEAMGFVDWFNRGFGKSLGAIGSEEIVAKGDLGPVKMESYFRFGTGKELADRFQKLRASFGNTPGKPEWRDQLAELLRQYAEWKPAGDEIDIFHQRITVLHGLWQLIPAGEDRGWLLSQVIAFLKGNEVEREYPAEWLFQVRALMDAGMDAAPAERAKLLAAFRESGDAGLVLLAATSQ
jgi:hypothetical protein